MVEQARSRSAMGAYRPNADPDDDPDPDPGAGTGAAGDAADGEAAAPAGAGAGAEELGELGGDEGGEDYYDGPADAAAAAAAAAEDAAAAAAAAREGDLALRGSLAASGGRPHSGRSTTEEAGGSRPGTGGLDSDQGDEVEEEREARELLFCVKDIQARRGLAFGTGMRVCRRDSIVRGWGVRLRGLPLSPRGRSARPVA